MLSLLVRRLLGGLGLVLFASVLVFIMMEIIPGDPAFFVVGRDASPEVVAQVRETLNLDEPAPARYLDWLGGFVRADFGQSALLVGSDLNDYLKERAVNTGVLTGVTLALLVPASLALGVTAAVRRDRPIDHAISGTMLFSVGFPDFVVGIVLVALFAVHWEVFPAIATFPLDPSFATWTESLVLPVATLLIVALPHTIRLVRGSMIEALDSEYVEALRLRGTPEKRVIWRHALPNALGPSIQSIALNAAWLIGGVVVIENVFNYPGVGQAVVSALTSHDAPVVESVSCLLVLAYVVLTTIADVSHLALNPRLREGRHG
jgi:peptide/nickel transport system permease protein